MFFNDHGIKVTKLLYQPRVSFYRLFDALRFNADVALRHACAAVLQKALHKGNVITAILVNFCCIPLAEAVGANPLKAQIVTHKGKLFLYRPFGQGKNAVIATDPIAQALDGMINTDCFSSRFGYHCSIKVCTILCVPFSRWNCSVKG